MDWTRFAISALYLLASPSTPSEAIAEVVERSDAGEMVTYAVARGVVRRVKRMKEVLGTSSPKIVEFVENNDVDDPELVETLQRLEVSGRKPGSNGTFDEIMETGGFHFGENSEKWCDVANSTAQERYAALDELSRAHRMITPSRRSVAISELVSASKGLALYRTRVDGDDFRVQEADEYIERIRRALLALGEW